MKFAFGMTFDEFCRLGDGDLNPQGGLSDQSRTPSLIHHFASLRWPCLTPEAMSGRPSIKCSGQ